MCLSGWDAILYLNTCEIKKYSSPFSNPLFFCAQSNVCNQVKSAPSEETAVLLKRSSPSLPSSKLSFDSSVLNSPRSVEDAMMEKPSRSPSVSSDVDDSETASTKSNEISTSKPKSCKRIKTSQSDAERSIVNAEKAMKENEVIHLFVCFLEHHINFTHLPW